MAEKKIVIPLTYGRVIGDRKASFYNSSFFIWKCLEIIDKKNREKKDG